MSLALQQAGSELMSVVLATTKAQVSEEVLEKDKELRLFFCSDSG